MTIKELYDEAIKVQRELGLVGGDKFLLMNTIINLKMYNEMLEDKNKVVSETKSTKKV